MSGSDRRSWVPVLAATSVAAVGLAIAIPRFQGDSEGPRGEPSYVVRDGDRVEVTGLVIAAPDQPVVYCPSLPTAADRPEAAPGCSPNFAVTLTGVDLDRLAEPGTKNGVRFGYAQVRGLWRERSIAVEEQSVPPKIARPVPTELDTVPCPEPSGGWKVPDPPLRDLPSTTALERFAQQHPGRYGAIWNAFPQGFPPGTPEWTVPVVLVVTLLDGDVEQAEKELQPLYEGNLCLSPGHVTNSRLTEAANAAHALMLDKRNGIWETSGIGSGETLIGPIEVTLLVVDERLYGEYQKIGLDLVDLHPDVRPIR